MRITLFCNQAKTDRSTAVFCREIKRLNALLAAQGERLSKQSRELSQKDLEILTLKLAIGDKA